MMPQNVLSRIPAVGNFLTPDNIDPNEVSDYELGGIGLNDASQGLQVQTWKLTIVGSEIMIEAPNTARTPLFAAPGTTWVSLAFDQNMNPAVAFVQNGISQFRYYDTVTEGYITINLPAGAGIPCVCMDDKRGFATQLNSNDIILAYVRNGNLYFLMQGERYETEHLLKSGVTGQLRRIGMNDKYCLQFMLAVPST